MLKQNIKKLATFGLLFIFLFNSFSPVFAALNIKKDYCGAVLDYRYCKCAFHGNQKDDKWCDMIGMTQESANEYVYNSFEAWKAELERKCVEKGHFWVDEQCLVPPKCSKREVMIGWECKSISEFCGKDPVILYDVESKKCYCPEYYELKTEKGEKQCVAQEEISLQIEVVEGNPLPPFLADGETETRFKIKATYVETGNPVSFKYKLSKYSDRANGFISLETLDIKEGSIIFYKTPNLTRESETVFRDTIHLTYYSYLKKKDEVKTINIILYNSQAETMTISRDGFESRTVPLIFDSRWADVYVYTKAGFQTYPVVGAEILYQKSWKEKTNWEGVANLYNHGPHSDKSENKKISVQLSLEPSLRLKIKRAQEHYEELGASNKVISNFLRNFAGYLAVEESQEKIEQMKTLLQSLDYSLFFLSQGNKLSDDATLILGDALGMILWDTLEFVISLDRFTNKAKEVLGKWGGKLAGQLDELPPSVKTDITDLQYFLQEWGTNPLKRVWQRLVLSMLEKAEYITPSVFNDIFKGLSKFVLEAKTLGKSKDFFDKVGIQTFTTNSLKAADKKMYANLLNQTVNQLRKRNINPDLLGNEIEKAKEDYLVFTEKYLDFHAAKYNLTMFKTYTETALTIGSGLAEYGSLIFAPQFFVAVKKVCTAIDKGYKGIRVAILDSSELIDWLNIYFKNRYLVKTNVSSVMQFNYAYSEPNFKLTFADVVKAAQEAEIDLGFDQETAEILQALSDSQAGPNDSDREKVFEYLYDKTDLAFYNDLYTIVSLTANLAPDDQELRQASNDLKATVQDLEQKVKDGKKEIKDFEIIKPAKDGGEGVFSRLAGQLEIFKSKFEGIFAKENKITFILLGALALFILIFILGIVLHKRKMLILGLVFSLIALSNLIGWIIQGSFKSPDFDDFKAGPNSADFVDLEDYLE